MMVFKSLRFLYRGLKAQHRDQKIEIQLLTKHLKPNQTVLDIGANKGSYLPSLSRAVPHGQLYAFEPQPSLAAYLTEICKITQLTNVTVEPFAGSDIASKRTLYVPGDKETSPGASLESIVAASEHTTSVLVQSITLDEYFENKDHDIGAMKLDVEGHEFKVLQGSLNIIKKYAPLIICECEQRHQTDKTVSEIVNFVSSLHYRGFLITRKNLLPISEFDPVIHQRQVGERYWDKPGYFNNFVFFPNLEVH